MVISQSQDSMPILVGALAEVLVALRVTGRREAGIGRIETAPAGNDTTTGKAAGRAGISKARDIAVIGSVASGKGQVVIAASPAVIFERTGAGQEASGDLA